jgi:hypothetical protein
VIEELDMVAQNYFWLWGAQGQKLKRFPLGMRQKSRFMPPFWRA